MRVKSNLVLIFAMIVTFIFPALSGCQLIAVPPANKALNVPFFMEVSTDVAPFEARSRRKWEGPVIADLDQDGWPDMVLTEHGHSVAVYWNNEGVFSQPKVMVRRDTHGVSVSDFDGDGLYEIMISQGGGRGSKPKMPLVYQVNKDRSITKGQSMTHFEFTRGRALKHFDADNDGDLELLSTGFPLKIQTKGANHLYDNEGESYRFIGHLPQAKWLGYKSLVADINGDGIADNIFYGGQNLVYVQGKAGLEFEKNTKLVFAELADISYVSSMTPIDFDNDGDLDLFFTRARHQFHRQSFYSSEDQTFAFFGRNEKFSFDDLVIEGDFVLENLQMAFPHFDLYYGENKTPYVFKVDRHGHKDLKLTQQQAKGFPSNLDKKGLYIGYLGNNTWRIAGETKSPTAGVVRGVINRPSTIEQEFLPAKLLENRDGQFIDRTSILNMDLQQQTTNATSADFNNDGWADLFVMKYGNMATENQHIVFLNQQGKGFEVLKTGSPHAKEIGSTGSGSATIDFDLDGDTDLVFAQERGRWHLFENLLDNDNRSIAIEVGLSPTKRGTYQLAKVEASSCGLNQTKYVALASSAFSNTGTNRVHFGLGRCHDDVSLQVTWSNGEYQKQTVKASTELLYFGH